MTKEIKNALINAAWLSDYEGTRKLVLIRLAYFTRLVGDFADPSQITLAHYCSCSERQIRYHLEALQADGVLDWKLVRENGFHNRYTLKLEALAKRQSISGKGLPGGNEVPDESGNGLPEGSGNRFPVSGGNGLPETVSITESNKTRSNDNGCERIVLTDLKTNNQNPYLNLTDQIFDTYPMEPRTPEIAKKWKLAIEIEIQTIMQSKDMLREEAAKFLLDRVQRYAALGLEKIFGLEKFMKDGVYTPRRASYTICL